MSEGEEQDEAQKTEDPTQKRLEDSRKKGQVPLSREVNNWTMLAAGTIIIASLSPSMFSKITHILTEYIARAESFPAMPGGLEIALGEGMKETMLIMVMPLVLLFLVAGLSSFLQIGPLWSPESIKVDMSKISPMQGFKRIFSMRSIVEFVKGIVKIGIISAVGLIIISPYMDKFEAFVGMSLDIMMDEMLTLIIRMMIGILIALLIIAVIDLVYQRYEHMKKMRMTKQEVKDEYKQMEGDPQIKGKLRQLRAQRARQRMMQAVPQADVVITNPTHFSIALKYDPQTMDAPKCIAKGIDEVALRIREVAKAHDIILFENRALARILYDTVEIDEVIPQEHFKAVAEVISYVFKMKGKNAR
jgi:flagellar biosynthetic protein FlhB